MNTGRAHAQQSCASSTTDAKRPAAAQGNCEYARMRARIHVCMFCANAYMQAAAQGDCEYARMHARIHVCTFVCMFVCKTIGRDSSRF